MLGSTDQQLVENAQTLLSDGYQVFIGRNGVEKLVEIESIFVGQDTNLVVYRPVGCGAFDQYYLAAGQLATVEAIDTNNLVREVRS